MCETEPKSDLHTHNSKRMAIASFIHQGAKNPPQLFRGSRCRRSIGSNDSIHPKNRNPTIALDAEVEMEVDADVDVESIHSASDLLMLQLKMEVDQGRQEDYEELDPDIDVQSVCGQSDLELLRSEHQYPSIDTYSKHEHWGQTFQAIPTAPTHTPSGTFDANAELPPLPPSNLPPIPLASSHNNANGMEDEMIGALHDNGPLPLVSLSQLAFNNTLELPRHVNLVINSMGLTDRIRDQVENTLPRNRTQMLNDLHAVFNEHIAPVLQLNISDPDSMLKEILDGERLSALTISIAAIYLFTETLMLQESEQVDFALGLPTALPWGNGNGWEYSVEVRDLAILGADFPRYVYLPVVDRTADHCYLWYITCIMEGSVVDIHFYLIDSAGKKNKSVLVQRASPGLQLVANLFPGYEPRYHYSQRSYRNFQQDPSSLHCGFYLCQALSAGLLHQFDRLEHPLEVTSVQVKLTSILLEFTNGTFVQKLLGLQRATGIKLHRQFIQPQALQSPARETSALRLKSQAEGTRQLDSERDEDWVPEEQTCG
ncbi:hypothetical protein CTheo_8188 [Ceratobasidium theobromae]|uniref:Uncharacterized protein n=1 Tax=Ceratobasidium theobromae TaxID=1582974 RepID=A0A5N5QAA2_9AGAM|nr:hypothetical protein CTheo_8188 [Ceratobasidium theobromae]